MKTMLRNTINFSCVYLRLCHTLQIMLVFFNILFFQLEFAATPDVSKKVFYLGLQLRYSFYYSLIGRKFTTFSSFVDNFPRVLSTIFFSQRDQQRRIVILRYCSALTQEINHDCSLVSPKNSRKSVCNTKFLKPCRIRVHRLLLCFEVVEPYPSFIHTKFTSFSNGAQIERSDQNSNILRSNFQKFVSFSNRFKIYDVCGRMKYSVFQIFILA